MAALSTPSAVAVLLDSAAGGGDLLPVSHQRAMAALPGFASWPPQARAGRPWPPSEHGARPPQPAAVAGLGAGGGERAWSVIADRRGRECGQASIGFSLSRMVLAKSLKKDGSSA